jgi:hypothetical protein
VRHKFDSAALGEREKVGFDGVTEGLFQNAGFGRFPKDTGEFFGGLIPVRIQEGFGHGVRWWRTLGERLVFDKRVRAVRQKKKRPVGSVSRSSAVDSAGLAGQGHGRDEACFSAKKLAKSRKTGQISLKLAFVPLRIAVISLRDKPRSGADNGRPKEGKVGLRGGECW